MADENKGQAQTQPFEAKPLIEFKRSDIAAMSPAEYAANRDEILRSQRAGVIKDDLSKLKENIDQQKARKLAEQ